MVLREAASAFWRKRRLPLSSTMQIVTSTLRFLASASAAATMVLMAARLMNFLDGRSAAEAVVIRASITKSSLNMGGCYALGWRFSRWKVARPERLELPTLWFEARCSIQLSYGRAKPLYLEPVCGESATPARFDPIQAAERENTAEDVEPRALFAEPENAKN